MLNWTSLGKKRTKFGKWIDSKGISQQDVSKSSGINRNTISKLCSDSDFKPKISTGMKIVKALQKLGHQKDYYDFWG